MNRLSAILALLVFAVAAPASAQVLTFETTFDGELGAEDEELFRDALQDGISSDPRVNELIDEDDTAELLGDGASCTDVECAAEAGEESEALVGVYADVYAEAEIYDFAITVFDLREGTILAQEAGDCTFCPTAEAVETFRRAAATAIGDVDEMPRAESDEEPVEPAEPAVADTDLVEGDIAVGISAVPTSAEIRVNGQLVGVGRANLELAPQELEIVFIADDHEEYAETMRLTESMVGPIFLRARLTPTVAQAPPRGTGSSGSSSGDGASFNRRSVGGVMAGAGGATLITGIVLLALDGQTTCSEGPVTSCADVYETTAGGVVLTTVGALAAGVGGGLILSTVDFGSERREASSGGRGTVALQPSRGGAMLRLDARW